MAVGTGLYMYDVVIKKFTFAISPPDEFLYRAACASVYTVAKRIKLVLVEGYHRLRRQLLRVRWVRIRHGKRDLFLPPW